MTAMELVGWFAVGCVVGKGLHLGLQALRRRRRTERTVECTCGLVLPVSKAHLVATRFESEEERALGGGTAVVAEFCRAHCPGNCNHPKEHR